MKKSSCEKSVQQKSKSAAALSLNMAVYAACGLYQDDVGYIMDA